MKESRVLIIGSGVRASTQQDSDVAYLTDTRSDTATRMTHASELPSHGREETTQS